MCTEIDCRSLDKYLWLFNTNDMCRRILYYLFGVVRVYWYYCYPELTLLVLFDDSLNWLRDTSDLYMTVAHFISQLKLWLLWQVLMFSFTYSRKIIGFYLKVGCDLFLSHPFHFIVHLSSDHWTLYCFELLAASLNKIKI